MRRFLSTEKKIGVFGSESEFAGKPFASRGIWAPGSLLGLGSGWPMGALHGAIERLVHEKWRIEPRARIRVWPVLLPAIEHPVPRAQHGLRSELPGQSDARRKIVQIGIDQPAASGRADLHVLRDERRELRRLSLWHDDGGIAGIAQIKIPVSLNRSDTVPNKFVAQPKVQHQVRRDLPVVLCIERIRVSEIVDVVQIVDAATVW